MMQMQQKQDMGGGTAAATAQTRQLNFGSFDLAEIMNSPAKIIGIVTKLVRIILLVSVEIFLVSLSVFSL